MQEKIQLAVSVLTLLGIIFAIYKFFRDPDIQVQNEIMVMKSECEMKHKYIDENLVLIKENHLKHIEKTMLDINNRLIRIETKLEKI